MHVKIKISAELFSTNICRQATFQYVAEIEVVTVLCNVCYICAK